MQRTKYRHMEHNPIKRSQLGCMARYKHWKAFIVWLQQLLLCMILEDEEMTCNSVIMVVKNNNRGILPGGSIEEKGLQPMYSLVKLLEQAVDIIQVQDIVNEFGW
ncbi:hypothetical protein BDB01DRAFT_836850 [Pilobolus umbonatus]|nr:hypothetical protein BDB01DRAFT_836850 [Pilobolus umbonatus]